MDEKYFIMYRRTGDSYEIPGKLKTYLESKGGEIVYESKVAPSLHYLGPKGLSEELKKMDLVQRVSAMAHKSGPCQLDRNLVARIIA